MSCNLRVDMPSLVQLSEEVLLLDTLGILSDGRGRGADLLLQPRHSHLVLVPEERLQGGEEGDTCYIASISSGVNTV